MYKHYREERYGFHWGFMRIERTASNDGNDKKKAFACLNITHDNGQRIEIFATKEGLRLKTFPNNLKNQQKIGDETTCNSQ